MMSVTSSPSNGSGNRTNGPLTTLHDENVGRVVVDRTRLVVARHHEDAVVRFLPHRRLGAQRVEVGVGIVLHGPVPEEVRRRQIAHAD